MKWFFGCLFICIMSTRDYIFSAAFYIVVHRMGKIINDGILSQQTTSCDGDEFSFWECQLSANRFLLYDKAQSNV